MTGYGFFKSLQAMFGLLVIVVAGLSVFVGFICSELSTEAKFHSKYGATWRAEYEAVHGPLTKAHAKIAVSGAGIIAVSALTVWLYRQLRPNDYSRRPSNGSKNAQRRRFKSGVERIIWHRRNAILGIYFGLAGILLGAFLVVFRLGIFDDHANEIVLGIFIFLAGYTGVMVGCSNWLKAKQWNDAVVFIGLMPLVIPFIPFVRLILLASPAILPLGMVMMPLILIGIIFVLPDKSGMSGRKP